mgnify:FL=1
MEERLPIIPYNTTLVEYARENRKNQTKAEWLLWHLVLKNKQLLGYKFRRQKVVHSFILDFYCSKLLLGIELDGGYHKETQEYDEERSEVIAQYGIKIVRFCNEEIEKNLEWVILALEEIIQERVREMEDSLSALRVSLFNWEVIPT